MRINNTRYCGVCVVFGENLTYSVQLSVKAKHAGWRSMFWRIDNEDYQTKRQ